MMAFILSIDSGVLEYLFSLRSLPLTHFFIAVTAFGDTLFIAGATISTIAWLAVRARYADVAGLTFCVSTAAAVVMVTKYLVDRPRPDLLLYQAYAEGAHYSFPSAHATLAMAFFGFVVYLILQSHPTPARRVLEFGLPVLIFLIGFSRLYLGVHYFSDVVTGYAIGLVCIAAGRIVRLRVLTQPR